MPGQTLYFHGTTEATTVTQPLNLSPSSDAAGPDLKIALPGCDESLRIVRYIPNAILNQMAIPDDSDEGRAAIELTVEGPSQSYRRWLIVDDPERNRMISFIGTWRMMAVEGLGARAELLSEFQNELTRKPVLQITQEDGTVTKIPVILDSSYTFKNSGCRVRIRSFLPSYAHDGSGKPESRSDKRHNPAVQVELEQGDVKELRWVFAKFPEFQKQEGEKLPLRLKLDCPIESERDVPDYAVVNLDHHKLELWIRFNGRIEAKPLEIDRSVQIKGSHYQFRVTNFLPKGKLVESYRKADSGVRGGPALQLEYTAKGGGISKTWLSLGKSRTILTKDGPATVVFDYQLRSRGDAHRGIGGARP